MTWTKLIKELGVLDSRKEAQRLLLAGAIDLDGNPLQADDIPENIMTANRHIT